MLSRFLTRLKALVKRRAVDAELDEEIRYHLEREIDRNVASGMSPRDAHDAARRALGNLTVATEQARDAWRWTWLEELKQDTVFGLRSFRRAPVFVVTVVGTIGLGLGLLAAAFALFDAYVLRPVQVRDPSSLYVAAWNARNGSGHRFSWSQYTDLSRRRDIFSESFAYADQWTRLRGVPSTGQLVTGNYFQMLGVPPALGRVIGPQDAAAPGSNAVIVLSHHAWRTTFGGDSSVIGTRTRINGVPLVIIGVAREGFGGLTESPFDYWVPITMIEQLGPSSDLFTHPLVEGVRIVGRVRPENGVDRTRAMLTTWLQSNTASLPILERANDAVLVSRGTLLPRTREVIALFAPIAIAFSLVLLVACANVSNMMLARGMARQREVGIRLALGAGRARLIRQLLTEALLLGVPSGVMSFLISRSALGISIGTIMASIPEAYRPYLRIVPMEATSRVILFMVVGAVVVALLFGLVPALQTTRPDIVRASRGDFDAGRRPSTLRNALVIAQVSFSVVLLVCAGVLLASARQTAAADPGVRVANLLQVQTLEDRRERTLAVLRDRRDVVSVGSASSRPLDGSFNTLPLIAGSSAAEQAWYNQVSPDYFGALDLPIVAGRNFTDNEARSRAPVVIVSQWTARHFWPDRSPIGEIVRVSPSAPGYNYQWMESYRTARVIGVSGNAVPGLVVKGVETPVVYYPQPVNAAWSNLIVRVRGDAEAARAEFERAIAAAVDSGAVTDIHTLEASHALQVYPFRAAYWIATAIGSIALALTLTGIYGVLGYTVAQRRKEFGIRMALGGAASSLVALVLRQSARLSLIGVGIGLSLALLFSRLLMSVVKVINAFDAAGYAAGALLVLAACLIASYIPARRAALVNPVETLRADS